MFPRDYKRVVNELKAKELADIQLEADLQKKDAFEELKRLASGGTSFEKVEHVVKNGAPQIVKVCTGRSCACCR